LLSYGQLEALIARIHGAPADVQAGALRARIRHLRRLGLPLGISPGTGNSIAYGKEQIYELSFCLELEQCGVDPRLAVGLLKAHRVFILHAYAKAEAAIQKNEGYFFWLETEFMTASWTTAKRKFPGLPQIGHASVLKLDRTVCAPKSMIVLNLATIAAEVLQRELSSKAVSEISET
jgi:hypothetical protein